VTDAVADREFLCFCCRSLEMRGWFTSVVVAAAMVVVIVLISGLAIAAEVVVVA